MKKTTAKEVEEYYDEFSERQQRVGINHRHLSVQRWLEGLGLRPDDHVLEVGSGIGTVSELILRFLGPEGSLVLNDISDKSMSLAEKRLGHKYNNAQFISGDVTKLVFENKFDVIVLPDVIEHIPIENHTALFTKLREHLEGDGFIFIHIPDPTYQEWLKIHKLEEMQIIDQTLYLDDLSRNLKAAGLKVAFAQSYSIYHDGYEYMAVKAVPDLAGDFKLKARPLIDSNWRRVLRKAKFIFRGGK